MSEIQKMLTWNYDECCEHLIKKYGQPNKPYFCNPECKSTTQIKRTKEGLFIHHIDEDKAIKLSDTEDATKNPFEYQLPHRLVYCNSLEHMVLHIKIMQYPHPNKNPNETVGSGGLFQFILPQIADFYSGVFKKEWHKKCAEVIADFEDDYLKCIEFIIDFLIEHPDPCYLDFPHYYFLKKFSNLSIGSKIKEIYLKKHPYISENDIDNVRFLFQRPNISKNNDEIIKHSSVSKKDENSIIKKIFRK